MPLAAEVQALMQNLAAQPGKPLHEMTVQEARALSAALADWSGPAPATGVEDIRLPVAGGDILLRVLTPEGTPKSVLLFIHGGGWVLGSADESTGLGQRLAVAAGAVVVLVDYRMAPEHPFPVPVDDCLAALDWTAARFAGLPLFVGGDSAGGNLTTVVATLARDRGGPSIRGLVLIYPVADADFDRPSYRAPDNQQVLTAEGMVWFWNHYLPDPAQRRDPRASPLFADLTGLPPACVVIAEYDVLRDEVEALADAMEAAGVAVDRMPVPGQIHGFISWGGVLPGANAVTAQLAEWMRGRS